jgi:hypothetical protein
VTPDTRFRVDRTRTPPTLEIGMTRLCRSDCSTPGLRRRGRGRGFEYRSYIDSRVFDRYRVGTTIGKARRAGSLDEAYLPSAQRRIERAVMRLISG